MRYIKFSIIGLIVLFVLLTFIGLLMPSVVMVGRSATIGAPLDSVRYYTNDPANWRYWINGADTAFYKQLTPATGLKGSELILGTYTITVLENDPDTIYTLWQGQSTKEHINKLDLANNNTGDSTIVNWAFQQQLSWYPWERLGAMLFDKVYGPSMEVSLLKLKKVCEKQQY
ncbi:MAG: hypothetical protein JST21_14590 [Bacteroidetes bacterium]|nr:hypothetical protein [Bacteroidota bacterium]